MSSITCFWRSSGISRMPKARFAVLRSARDHALREVGRHRVEQRAHLRPGRRAAVLNRSGSDSAGQSSGGFFFCVQRLPGAVAVGASAPGSGSGSSSAITSASVMSSARTVTSISPDTPVASWSVFTSFSAWRSCGTSSRTSETTSLWVSSDQADDRDGQPDRQHPPRARRARHGPSAAPGRGARAELPGARGRAAARAAQPRAQRGSAGGTRARGRAAEAHERREAGA